MGEEMRGEEGGKLWLVCENKEGREGRMEGEREERERRVEYTVGISGVRKRQKEQESTGAYNLVKENQGEPEREQDRWRKT